MKQTEVFLEEFNLRINWIRIMSSQADRAVQVE